MPIPLEFAAGLLFVLGKGVYEAIREGRDELSPEAEAALIAEGEKQRDEWKRLFGE